MVDRVRTVIMGAAGRDFHNFNVYFRNRPEYEVVAFTATQIPGIEGRTYPPTLSGDLYPAGILILPEVDLPKIIREKNVDLVILAYSDISHEEVMHKASLVLACGADFRLMGPKTTMLKSRLPVVAVCAVRTGAGKSPVSRSVSRSLKKLMGRVVVIRHPMPYGDLSRQVCERFASYDDLNRYECTIEEREEYEPHIDIGNVVYAGVDYEKILREAEKEADVILWDGGNNDLSFYKPNLQIVVVDPLRAGHELAYYPGETNLRMADVVVINKVDSATPDELDKVRRNVKSVRPEAKIVEAASEIKVEDENLIRGKRVVVVEDGPTVTHGGMKEGAGAVAARRLGAKEIIDPKPYAVGSIKTTYEKYPHLGKVLPAMGYGEKQIEELKETIQRIDFDSLVIGTPIDLRKVMDIKRPAVRVRYEVRELTRPTLAELLQTMLKTTQ
ncbi:MAG TPA: cyclic 2,3-diphosphoglycerate synthase [Candidatus Dormibacteraeota bacterium]|nr:cyclic 2,3-diphosphoglycerate synthase [Candidatus Dormibacteraeota bacterium]